MEDWYLGEIRMFAGNFAPRSWEICDGKLLSVTGPNSALFNLIGITYGGDGVNNFALPDLRSRVPINQGKGPGLSTRLLGQTGGAEEVRLTRDELPAHTHRAQALKEVGNTGTPKGHYWSGSGTMNQFVPGNAASVEMLPTATVNTGGNQPHYNMQPYLPINFIISLTGETPTQN